jgi:polysaccharide export outer membrane protein
LVIRERNDKREFARIDIQDKNLFMSPFFYLSPNDIVYIEPLKAKQYATQGDFFQRYSTLFIPLASLTTFFLGVVFF